MGFVEAAIRPDFYAHEIALSHQSYLYFFQEISCKTQLRRSSEQKYGRTLASKAELAQHWHANPNLNFLPFQTSRAKQTLLVNFWKRPHWANEKSCIAGVEITFVFDVIARKKGE